MINFGKDNDNDNDDETVEILNYRYDLSSVADEEIADVLLQEKLKAPFAADFLKSDIAHQTDTALYDFVVENKDYAIKESATVNLNEQVEKLCREYETINQQLEKSLVASNVLTKQLAKSKKLATVSYIALSVGGLAFFVGLGSVMIGVDMQRDVADLTDSVTSLATQVVKVKKEPELMATEIRALATPSSEPALASKNLPLMNAQNQLVKVQGSPNAVSQPSLASSSVAKKTLPNVAKSGITNKFKKARLSKTKQQILHRVVSKVLKHKQKVQADAVRVKKTLATHSTVLPTLPKTR